MPLLKHGKRVDDPWRRVAADEPIPPTGAVLLTLARFEAGRATLAARTDPLGVLLAPHESPEAIAGDLARLGLVALEFPSFRDGRAYSSARILRERYGYRGELRAVGDVELEHLAFMERCGFDAFEVASADPERDWQVAQSDFSLWYQPAADRRPTVIERRHRS